MMCKIIVYYILLFFIISFNILIRSADIIFDSTEEDSLFYEGSGIDNNRKIINSRSLKNNHIFGVPSIKRLLVDPSIKNNVSVKIQLLRIDELLSSQRVEITFWLHEVYNELINVKDIELVNYINDGNEMFNRKFMIEDKDFPLSNVVIKNALFLRIHRNPMTNSFFMINQNGTLSIHTKVTTDVPCVHLSSSHSGANPLQMVCVDSMYKLPNFGGNKKINDKAVCQMEIGSFLKPSSYLNLTWDTDAILDGTIPCSNENWPRCLVDQIHTFKIKESFVNEDHDHLVACFLLNIQRIFLHAS